MRKRSIFLVFFLSFIYHLVPAEAHGTALPKTQHDSASTRAGTWSFDFTLEGQNWEEIDAAEAHRLHHQGHDVHVKAHEEFYHFTLGRALTHEISILVDMPYVVRESIEVEDHDDLGKRQISKGLGDLTLVGTYEVLETTDGALSILGGVKFPTGSTEELNSQGEVFETELQPGSGSWDYPIGATYIGNLGVFPLEGQILYTIKSEGDQTFEAGDTLRVSVSVNDLVKVSTLHVGCEVTYELEAKETKGGVENEDSGGGTLFIGPRLEIELGEYMSLEGAVSFPVYQELGGYHQELDLAFELSAHARW